MYGIIPYIITALAMVAALGNAYQKDWSFLIWIFTNLYFALYNISIGEPAQSILYSFYFLVAIIGIAESSSKK